MPRPRSAHFPDSPIGVSTPVNEYIPDAGGDEPGTVAELAVAIRARLEPLRARLSDDELAALVMDLVRIATQPTRPR